jgi:uncharacterized coiled-coil DUF342 family protein
MQNVPFLKTFLPQKNIKTYEFSDLRKITYFYFNNARLSLFSFYFHFLSKKMSDNSLVVKSFSISGNLSNGEDIVKLSESSMEISNFVNGKVADFQAIDVNATMKNLANVGNVIKLAYAGSKGFKCSEQTILILSEYQSLIHNSFSTMNAFVQSCLSALKYHKAAILLAEKEKFPQAIKIISKCAELAVKMAQESQKLVDEADKLINRSTEALQAAHSDENITRRQRDEIIRTMNEARVRQKELQTETEELHKQISEFKKEKAENAGRIETEREQAKQLALIGAITQPIIEFVKAARPGLSVQNAENSNGNSSNNSQAEYLDRLNSKLETLKKTHEDIENRKKELQASNEPNLSEQIQNLEKEKKKIEEKISQTESQIAKIHESNTQSNSSRNNVNAAVDQLTRKEENITRLVSNLQEKQRKDNAELAGLTVRLKSLRTERNDLDASIIALEITIKALGKVKTTFLQTKQFWIGVTEECKKLADIGVIETFCEAELQEQLLEELKKSALNWLSLGKINYTAATAIRSVTRNIDNTMSNLPSKREALELVQREADLILNSLQQENFAIQN